FSGVQGAGSGRAAATLRATSAAPRTASRSGASGQVAAAPGRSLMVSWAAQRFAGYGRHHLSLVMGNLFC
ncbi:hypothetical protein, partial [Acidithiobacillus sp. MC2.2]|uniref:hypothetical protein n=1 Tax=Acidithiobacillus sp. MC2.2 TaxID=2801579 RepID=UPI0019D1F0F5